MRLLLTSLTLLLGACAGVERDARGNPVTRAMLLGREKHTLALECIQQKLHGIRPARIR